MRFARNGSLYFMSATEPPWEAGSTAILIWMIDGDPRDVITSATAFVPTDMYRDDIVYEFREALFAKPGRVPVYWDEQYDTRWVGTCGETQIVLQQTTDMDWGLEAYYYAGETSTFILEASAKTLDGALHIVPRVAPFITFARKLWTP